MHAGCVLVLLEFTNNVPHISAEIWNLEPFPQMRSDECCAKILNKCKSVDQFCSSVAQIQNVCVSTQDTQDSGLNN